MKKKPEQFDGAGLEQVAEQAEVVENADIETQEQLSSFAEEARHEVQQESADFQGAGTASLEKGFESLRVDDAENPTLDTLFRDAQELFGPLDAEVVDLKEESERKIEAIRQGTESSVDQLPSPKVDENENKTLERILMDKVEEMGPLDPDAVDMTEEARKKEQGQQGDT